MIDPLSLIPLHIETYFNNYEGGIAHIETKISDATAFVYTRGFNKYLITNWHVITGRNPNTNRLSSKKAAIPNIVKVWFHGFEEKTHDMWVIVSIPLENYKDEHVWIEHPRGRAVDVVAIPINEYVFKSYPLSIELFNTKLDVQPSESVSIIGFPFGLSSYGSLPIWKTGHIASDIEQNYDGKPVFLVDGTFRKGMSGSPVIARRRQQVSDDKSILIVLDSIDRFLGIFSGGISKKYDTEIGMVWKPKVIEEIIDSYEKTKK